MTDIRKHKTPPRFLTIVIEPMYGADQTRTIPISRRDRHGARAACSRMILRSCRGSGSCHRFTIGGVRFDL